LLGARGAGGWRHASDRQAVVLSEITGRSTHGTERLGKAAGGRLGDVLVEGARFGTSEQDSLYGLRVEGTIDGGMCECLVEVNGIVALAQ
jgi:hypothetical protein